MEVNGKQETPFVWNSRWTVLLSGLLMWLPLHRCMITSDPTCVSQQLSLTCTDGWLIHIIYETYSYSSRPCSSDLDPGTVICTKAEFLKPISVGQCNGKSSCMFTVPDNTTISSCNQLATALSIHYQCVPETNVFTICSDVTFQHTEQIYLATPDFPSNILGMQKNCSCTLIGQNINGTILQQTRDQNSSVILILLTNHGTRHINGLSILNTHIFSNLTKVNLVLENQLDQQIFNIWLGFKGQDMSLKCQYDKPYPVTIPSEVTSDTTLSMPTIKTQVADSTVSLSLDQKISATPTQTLSSQSNTIHCSETQIGQTMNCKSDTSTPAIGLTSGISLPDSKSSQVDILPTESADLSPKIKETTEVTMVTKESQKSVIHTKTLTPTDKTQIQPSTAVRHLETSTVLRDNTLTSVTKTAVSGLPSSVISNSNTSSAGFQPKSADEDVVLLVIVGCLAFILLVAMTLFTIIMWRRANTNKYIQEDTHIYDAYHHDNGSVGPDPVGDNRSYLTEADESILI